MSNTDPILKRACVRMNDRFQAMGIQSDGAMGGTDSLRLAALGYDIPVEHINAVANHHSIAILERTLDLFDGNESMAVAVACKSSMVSGILLGLFAAQVAAEDRAAEREAESADA